MEPDTIRRLLETSALYFGLESAAPRRRARPQGRDR